MSIVDLQEKYRSYYTAGEQSELVDIAEAICIQLETLLVLREFATVKGYIYPGIAILADFFFLDSFTVEFFA